MFFSVSLFSRPLLCAIFRTVLPNIAHTLFRLGKDGNCVVSCPTVFSLKKNNTDIEPFGPTTPRPCHGFRLYALFFLQELSGLKGKSGKSLNDKGRHNAALFNSEGLLFRLFSFPQ